jgi:hypothetical protein
MVGAPLMVYAQASSDARDVPKYSSKTKEAQMIDIAEEKKLSPALLNFRCLKK